MPKRGQIPGVYNIVEREQYETFPTQFPVDAFVELLEDDDLPTQVTVVNLESAFTRPDFITELRRTMDRKGDDLEHADSPIIQFAVEADIHRSDRGNEYDLWVDGTPYPLRDVFGRQVEAQADDHSWLTSPF
ncbi:hypothetical protein [Halosegnis marinus]|uniref:DUF8076 domain-containing protein n=1 Tax=Halosegnis marinus TaxID=3034023 RepID=A0ABD5ZU23_9EURY|nr:hypothetical protein [Halosegnis sp. DT85]